MKDDFHERVKRLAEFESPNLDDFHERVKRLAEFEPPNLDDFHERVKRLAKFEPPNLDDFHERVKHSAKFEQSKIDEIFSINSSLVDFSDVISKINFYDIKLSEKDFEVFYDNLENEEVTSTVTQELKENKKYGKKISKRAMRYLKMVYCILRLILWFIDLSPLDITLSTIDAVTDNYQSHIENGEFLSLKESYNWITKEIKVNISKEDLKDIRMVTKDKLIVRDGKKLNTKINGKLNKLDVVVIGEKKRNRTYIIFHNKEDDEIIEGWVSTRYLKKVK